MFLIIPPKKASYKLTKDTIKLIGINSKASNAVLVCSINLEKSLYKEIGISIFISLFSAFSSLVIEILLSFINLSTFLCS